MGLSPLPGKNPCKCLWKSQRYPPFPPFLKKKPSTHSYRSAHRNILHIQSPSYRTSQIPSMPGSVLGDARNTAVTKTYPIPTFRKPTAQWARQTHLYTGLWVVLSFLLSFSKFLLCIYCCARHRAQQNKPKTPTSWISCSCGVWKVINIVNSEILRELWGEIKQNKVIGSNQSPKQQPKWQWGAVILNREAGNAPMKIWLLFIFGCAGSSLLHMDFL